MRQVFHNVLRVCNLKESRLMRHFILIYDTAKRKVLSRDTWPTFYLGFANTIVSNYKRNSTERLLKNGGMFERPSDLAATTTR